MQLSPAELKTTMSSELLSFPPAMEFYHALRVDDHSTMDRLLDTFFLPCLESRNRSAGSAVSIAKAGARIVGQDAGPFRPPLTDLAENETERLATLIHTLGPQ